ncbi:MAG TPA: ornithine cyclodeaminase family protein [Solirubrobacter sp.]|nr:ornithine cyclodeaminase family protein [Solirubrobacter sp.]
MLVFSESDAAACIGPADVPETIDVIERAYREKSHGAVALHPRQTIAYPPGEGYYVDSAIRLLCGFLPASGSAAMRIYPVSHDAPVNERGPRVLDYTMGQELLLYYRYDRGMELAAIFSNRHIMNLRTAAPTGVATRHMARPNASTLAVIGAGRHAPWQIRAACAVRPIERVRIHSPTRARREGLAADLTEELGIDVAATDSAEEAVRGADVVITVTNANEPVLDAAWLAPGAHVNVIARGEIDAATILRADVIACSWREQIVRDVPEFRPVGGLIREGRISEDAFLDLDACVDAGSARGDDAITLFLSQGVGLWDAAIAPWAYEKLVSAGRGSAVSLA